VSVDDLPLLVLVKGWIALCQFHPSLDLALADVEGGSHEVAEVAVAYGFLGAEEELPDLAEVQRGLFAMTVGVLEHLGYFTLQPVHVRPLFSRRKQLIMPHWLLLGRRLLVPDRKRQINQRAVLLAGVVRVLGRYLSGGDQIFHVHATLLAQLEQLMDELFPERRCARLRDVTDETLDEGSRKW
jgi:hypothetical protein